MWQFFIKGGIVMIPLGICSILGLAIVIERIIFYGFNNKFEQKEFDLLKLYLSQGKLNEAKDLITTWNSPVGRILENTISQWETDPSMLDQIAQSSGEEELKGLQRGLSLLDTIVTASPLLGLLGTVTGIIKSFMAMSVTSGNQASQLSAGIAEALYNTAFGIAIAIPALFFVNIFYGIADKRARLWNSKIDEILAILKKG